MESLSSKHKVPYNIFQKWFKDTRKVVEVKVDGIPAADNEEQSEAIMMLLFEFGLTFV